MCLSTIYIYIFQPLDEPLLLKFIYIFSHLTKLCRGNLKLLEIVCVIRPWVEWVGVLYFPTILLMKSKFHFRQLVPSKNSEIEFRKSQSI